MIIDCHTHIWEVPQQLGLGGPEYVRRQTGGLSLSADPMAHQSATACVDRCWVLAFRSRYMQAEIPNGLVARFVQAHPDRLLGSAGVDPLAEDLADQLARIAEQPAFKGVTISPAGQDFHPADSRLDRLYDFCATGGLVVFVHQGTHWTAPAKMEYARPVLWDEVLRDHPNLRMVIAHLGHPWALETIALLGKHPHLYADLAGLVRRPWHAYNVLCLAHEFGVMDKLLFGSDFPFLSAAQAIQSLYRLNELTHGTHLPHVPREQIRAIIERDALAALGIAGQ